MVVRDGERHAEFLAATANDIDLFGRVVGKLVQRDDRVLAELVDVLDVLLEIRQTGGHLFRVRTRQLPVQGAAVEFQRAHRGDQYHRRRIEFGLAALDVEELLRAQVKAETRLGDCPVGQVHRHPRRDHAVAAVCDVRERTAVNERRHPLQRLYEVGPERVPQQRQHRSGCQQLLGRDRLPLVTEGDEDSVEPRPHVVLVLGQAEHGHHLGGGRDIEPGLARYPLLVPSEADDRVAQCAIVHVHDPPPEDAAGIDPELIAEIDVVVEHRREQVVGRRDGVEVSGEVQVDPLTGNDLSPAAAGSAPLHPERGAQGRLAQRQANGLTEAGETLGQPDAGGRLSLAGLRRRDRRNENQAIRRRPWARSSQDRRVDLGDVGPVGPQVSGAESQPFGDGRDRSCLG